jgi:hypothetical protein
MCMVWFYTRLFLLPFIIYPSILYESHYLLERNGFDPLLYVAFKPLFVVGVGLLILLHLTWFTMFIRMFLLLLTKNETHDLSEHKHGEKDPLTKTDSNHNHHNHDAVQKKQN